MLITKRMSPMQLQSCFATGLDSDVLEEKVVAVAGVKAYQPGQFFRRELPCLLAVLCQLRPRDVVLIDGYVWLDSLGAPGLGAVFFSGPGSQRGRSRGRQDEILRRGASDADQERPEQPSAFHYIRRDGKRGRSGVCVGHARAVSNSDHAPARPPVVGECKGIAVETQTLTTSQ